MQAIHIVRGLLGAGAGALFAFVMLAIGRLFSLLRPTVNNSIQPMQQKALPLPRARHPHNADDEELEEYRSLAELQMRQRVAEWAVHELQKPDAERSYSGGKRA